MQGSHDAEERKQLKMAMRADPDAMVDLDDSHIVGSVSRQVFDLPPTKLEVTEYRAFVYEVPGTGARIRGEFPQGVSSSTQYGPRFHAWRTTS